MAMFAEAFHCYSICTLKKIIVNNTSYSYSTFSGGNDYVSVNDLVTFEPQPGGQPTQQCTDITIRDDEVLEDNEMFMVEIQTSSRGVSLDSLTSSATVVIVDEDSALLKKKSFCSPQVLLSLFQP